MSKMKKSYDTCLISERQMISIWLKCIKLKSAVPRRRKTLNVMHCKEYANEGATKLLRIIDRAIDIYGLTMEQVVMAIEEPSKISDALNTKVQQFIDDWARATGVTIEELLEAYCTF
jgi:hypothetical protein